MPRIRSIHPTVCMSEDAGALSDGAERTMMRLLTHTDDEGRGQDRPQMIASLLYPDMPEKDGPTVDAHLDELAKVGIITRYTVAGKRYYAFPEWDTYQSPQKPTRSKVPPPQEADDTPTPDPERPTETPTVEVQEDDGSRPVTLPLGGEGRGEGVGGDRDHGAARRDDLDGMPLQAEPSLTFAQTLGRWVVSQGIKLPAKDRKAERYAAVLDCVIAHVPEEHPKRRGVVIAFIADYVGDVTGEAPDGDTRGHLARLVGEFDARAVMHAAGEAVGWGAGIGAEYANDPKAFTKYMARILYGERQTA